MAKKPELDDFRVPFFDAGKKRKPFDLSAIDPSAKPFSSGTKDIDRERLTAIGVQLDDLQEKLHAQRRRRVLLVLQGMDTSGKDGTVRAVFHDVDPLGLRIVPFRAPSEREAAHDFLWRVHAQAPMAGEFAIFNRSHYEDVLVPRVLKSIDADECERRYRHIREFEALLADSGTTIVKCFLHISKDEQRERLQARIDDPTKHWKFDVSDLEARKQWDDYQAAYADALAATSTDYAPWYIIPGNSKTHRNVMVAELLLRTMQDMKLEFPPAKESLKGVKVE
ncbi:MULTISPECIES: PPK2 family polyphosphate kinase [Caballeronia]|jgi:PPK2 family polyphosphate:nucleotide phosphotransferase|uniref:PPK2 family polyphosphate kinase n=1 Tax=Caballeronia TaxID=1827195 RepID=UPI00158B4F25|nr:MULTISPECIES: PPK2 family polyphosphate kinase [Caballeronia]MCI1041848.1 polyphosphate kinase 2 family protein [Caballeronia zhejiangensis]MDR5763869.1 polyphosphate kinase 2 family protein [Caballeronia sp. LZ028]MDR5785885.1 polyphosphate kinase 2 family protein [Caballeronia sp. LP003]MDR5791781.1 polyphosphate kinase 2 family protein [Caballeronia sp. LZ008]